MVFKDNDAHNKFFETMSGDSLKKFNDEFRSDSFDANLGRIKFYQLIIGTGLVCIAAYCIGKVSSLVTNNRKESNKLKQEYKIYPINDLNADSKLDLILESGQGHKTPLYAHVKNDGNIEYLSGYEMKKLDPNSIVDYKSIEDKLNEK